MIGGSEDDKAHIHSRTVDIGTIGLDTRSIHDVVESAAVERAIQSQEFGGSAYDLGNAEAGDAAAAPNGQHCARSRIVANPCESQQTISETSTTDLRYFKHYLAALRPHQWLKNVLVFFPGLAAHKFDWPTLLSSMEAFVCFSFVASGVYVVNDLLDIRADRVHPRKRYRPFASRSIPATHGTWIALGLIVPGGFIAMFIGQGFFLVMASYLLATTAYSLHFKRHIVIDICILAGLYTIRIVAGGIATSVPISVLLIAFSMFFFLSLAAVKRQGELVDSAGRGCLQADGRGYHVNDLQIISMIAVAAGYVSVLVMTYYVNSPAVAELYPHPQMLWGVCAVLLYWITRTVMMAHRGYMHDDPVIYAAKDRISQACLAIILVFVAAGMLV
ncbi:MULTISPECIES: UbiA family prenyltransferase [Microvirga]|uniref:UbiA family prenyltransferase n=1 Tax=Microvirga TaxID=186650 RepID=UPI001B35B5BE|nr:MULTISPECIES: UbiA family prenyltransferase [unclassified Microvirga]MBQ0820469.1 UbiA family prenyltransferase [Microvirga sp. HBU67558]